MRSIACIIVAHSNSIQGFPIAYCTSYKLFAEKNKYILLFQFEKNKFSVKPKELKFDFVKFKAK